MGRPADSRPPMNHSKSPTGIPPPFKRLPWRRGKSFDTPRQPAYTTPRSSAAFGRVFGFGPGDPRSGGASTSGSMLQRSRPRRLRRSAGLNTEKTMFAVIKTGGKQYRVAAEDEITVMTLPGEPGDVVAFEEVLALFDGETSHIGAPHVAGATVAG